MILQALTSWSQISMQTHQAKFYIDLKYSELT